MSRSIMIYYILCLLYTQNMERAGFTSFGTAAASWCLVAAGGMSEKGKVSELVPYAARHLISVLKYTISRLNIFGLTWKKIIRQNGRQNVKRSNSLN